MTKAVCDNCGEEVEAWTMESLNIGRRTLKLCSQCYRSGSKDVCERMIYRRVRTKDEKYLG
jgi:hypothetical protein